MALLDLGFLRSFITVYRARSVTAAARSLHLAQPTVSLHLKALEAQVGRPLFVRLPRGIAPTPAAHALAADVAPHLDALEAAADVHRGGRDAGAGGTVLLGGPSDLLSARALSALAPLVEQQIRIRAVTGLAGPLVDRLAAGELDLVVAAARPAAARRGLRWERLFDETFHLVGSPRWAGRIDRAALDACGDEALRDVPIVAYADDLPIVRRYFRTLWGRVPRRGAAIVIDDLRGVLTAVVAGAGVSVLPRYLLGDALARGEIVELLTPAEPPKNTIWLASRPGATSVSAAVVRGVLVRAAAGWR